MLYTKQQLHCCSVFRPIPYMFWPNLSITLLGNSLERTRCFHRPFQTGTLHAIVLVLKAKMFNMQVGSSLPKSLNDTEWYSVFKSLILIYIYILLKSLVVLRHIRTIYRKSNITSRRLPATSLILSFLEFLVLQNRSPNENPRLSFCRASTEKF